MIIYILLLITAIGIVIIIARKIVKGVMEVLNLNNGRVDIQNAAYEKWFNNNNNKKKNDRKH